MKTYTKEVKLKTEDWEKFINITDEVKTFIEQDKVITEGICVVFSTHTTAGIKIIENEALQLNDLYNASERIAPKTSLYQHDEVYKRQVPTNERINGHSHVKSFFGNTSETIPIYNGKLMLGKWQNIFFIDNDSGRDRKYIIMVIANG